MRIRGASHSSVETTFSGSGPSGQRLSEPRPTLSPETSAAPTAARSESSSSRKPSFSPRESRAGEPIESLAVVITGVPPSVSATLVARALAPPSCPPQRATANLPASSTVTTPGSRCLLSSSGAMRRTATPVARKSTTPSHSIQARWSATFALPHRGVHRARRLPGMWRCDGRSRLWPRARSRPAPRDDEHGALGCQTVEITDTLHPGRLQERGLYPEAAIFDKPGGGEDPFEGDEGQHDRPTRPDGGELDDLFESAATTADKNGVGFWQVVQSLWSRAFHDLYIDVMALGVAADTGAAFGVAFDGNGGGAVAGALDGHGAAAGADVPDQVSRSWTETGEHEGAGRRLRDHAIPMLELIFGKRPPPRAS